MNNLTFKLNFIKINYSCYKNIYYYCYLLSQLNSLNKVSLFINTIYFFPLYIFKEIIQLLNPLKSFVPKLVLIQFDYLEYFRQF